MLYACVVKAVVVSIVNKYICGSQFPYLPGGLYYATDRPSTRHDSDFAPYKMLVYLTTTYGKLTGTETGQNCACLSDSWDPTSAHQLWPRSFSLWWMATPTIHGCHRPSNYFTCASEEGLYLCDALVVILILGQLTNLTDLWLYDNTQLTEIWYNFINIVCCIGNKYSDWLRQFVCTCCSNSSRVSCH